MTRAMIKADTYFAKIKRPWIVSIFGYLGFVILFVLLAQYELPLAEAVSNGLSYVIDALRLIGIPFRDGYMDGPLPQHMYHTLVGVSIWVAVIWSVIFALPFIVYVFVTEDPTRYPRTLIKRGTPLYSQKVIWGRFACLFLFLINGVIFFEGVTGFFTMHPQDPVATMILAAAVAFSGYGFSLCFLILVSLISFDLKNLISLLVRFL